MKNLRIVSNGVENVSEVDTFLLRKLLDSYKENLTSVENYQIIDKHMDNIRANRYNIDNVMKLNEEFNKLQLFNRMIENSDKDYRDFEIADEVDEKNDEKND